MSQLIKEKFAIPLVVFAGLLWSFGPLVVRNMDEPGLVPWQYLCGRGIVIFFLLNCYLFFDEGIKFYKNYLKIGISGIIGGVGLGTAMITFIWSITNTSVAITLLCLAAMPFIAAIFGYLFLGELLRRPTLIAMVIALIGICVISRVDSWDMPPFRSCILRTVICTA